MNDLSNIPSRKNDPVSSRDAAIGVVASGVRNKQAITCALIVRKLDGYTAGEIAAKSRNYSAVRVILGRRLVDAERMGLIERGAIRTCKHTGRMSLTWHWKNQ